MFGKKKKKEEDAPEAEAEASAPTAEGEEGAEAAAPPKKKLSGKKLVLFIILPAVLVLGGGGAAAYMLFFKGGGEQHAEANAGHGKSGDAASLEGLGEAIPGPNGTTITHGENVVFVSMPELLVNITGPDGRPAYLKLRLTLEAPDDAAKCQSPRSPEPHFTLQRLGPDSEAPVVNEGRSVRYGNDAGTLKQTQSKRPPGRGDFLSILELRFCIIVESGRVTPLMR